MASRDAALAHCPLSNAYFSAKQLPLREALECGIRVGLGSDCAGGYALDMQVVMRHAVATSRIREGSRIIDRGASPVASQKDDRPVSIDWKEALFLATRGGALALGLEHCGIFRPGAAFDAQQSTYPAPVTNRCLIARSRSPSFASSTWFAIRQTYFARLPGGCLPWRWPCSQTVRCGHAPRPWGARLLCSAAGQARRSVGGEVVVSGRCPQPDWDVGSGPASLLRRQRMTP